ncbi:MAG: hypothetical protein IH582_05870 [Afipia sp.]|nr:hypothetical protein [Afipia sp.]
MFADLRSFARRLLVLTLGVLGAASYMTTAEAQIQDQWKPVEKTLSDYMSEGFALQTILLDRVTPVSVQATLYFLRKDNVLARCTETTTRRGGTITALSVSCAELGKPATLGQ